VTDAAPMLTVRVPLAARNQRGGGQNLGLTRGGMEPSGASAEDTTLVKAIARASVWRRQMEAGCDSTINDLAATEKINSSDVSLWLTVLTPVIFEAILGGQ
jgi:hypothetical protein